jgi:hypothetical protein
MGVIQILGDWDTAELPKSRSHTIGHIDHFRRAILGQVDLAIVFPHSQPGQEVLFLQAQGNMTRGHLAGILGWSARDRCPESGDHLEMGRPVFDQPVEDRPQQAVLSDIRVKVIQKFHQAVVSAHALEQRGS